MVDTALLRKQLMDELNAIHEKLRAIDIVESMSSPPGTPDPRIAPRAAGIVTVVGSAGDVTMSEYTLSLLTERWTSADDVVSAVRRKYPDTMRQGVMTALRRWEKRKVAESHGTKTKGFMFRLRPTPETEPEKGGQNSLIGAA